jgi:hypothetical protein
MQCFEPFSVPKIFGKYPGNSSELKAPTSAGGNLLQNVMILQEILGFADSVNLSKILIERLNNYKKVF